VTTSPCHPAIAPAWTMPMIEDLTLGHGNTFNFHVKVLRLIPSDGHALQLALSCSPSSGLVGHGCLVPSRRWLLRSRRPPASPLLSSFSVLPCLRCGLALFGALATDRTRSWRPPASPFLLAGCSPSVGLASLAIAV
jgi:hypothetical protein